MDLAKGDEFVTTYSGKVTNKNVVHNETVLTADDFDGIRDEKIVPGPEEGVYVTVHKTSEPPSGSVVKEKDEITYILTAINTGKDTVPFTQVRDVIPMGTTYKEVHDGGAYNEKGNYCEWVVKDLKTNESNREISRLNRTREQKKQFTTQTKTTTNTRSLGLSSLQNL